MTSVSLQIKSLAESAAAVDDASSARVAVDRRSSDLESPERLLLASSLLWLWWGEVEAAAAARAMFELDFFALLSDVDEEEAAAALTMLPLLAELLMVDVVVGFLCLGEEEDFLVKSSEAETAVATACWLALLLSACLDEDFFILEDEAAAVGSFDDVAVAARGVAGSLVLDGGESANALSGLRAAAFEGVAAAVDDRLKWCEESLTFGEDEEALNSFDADCGVEARWLGLLADEGW